MGNRVIRFNNNEDAGLPPDVKPGSPEWNAYFENLEQSSTQRSWVDANGDTRTIIGEGNYIEAIHGDYVQGDYVQGHTSDNRTPSDVSGSQSDDCSNSTNYVEHIHVGGRVIKGDKINGIAHGDSYGWGSNHGLQAPGTTAYSINPLTQDSACYKALVAVAMSPENPENVVELYQYMQQNYPEVISDESGNELEGDEFWRKTLEFVEMIGLRLV